MPAVLLVLVLSVHRERCPKSSEARPAAMTVNEQIPLDYVWFHLQDKSLSFGTEARTSVFIRLKQNLMALWIELENSHLFLCCKGHFSHLTAFHHAMVCFPS